MSRYSGLGASVFVNLDGDNESADEDFVVAGFYRQYFFNKKDYGARGFFAEGILQFATGESLSFNDDLVIVNGLPVEETENWSQVGIGFALGQKWVSRNGFVLEISLGAGRYFGDNDDENFDIPEAFFRGGFSVGYRF